ncbi:MAG: pseudouridine synthase [Bacteroidia bacterium]
MKIDKYIAQTGYTSRRKAQQLVSERKVTVNGKPATGRTEVKEGDSVLIEGKRMEAKEAVPTYIAYHKPKGIICTSEKIEGNIIDAVGHEQTIFPVGRLDKDSEGLILLTNDGNANDKIAHAEQGHEKEYIVTLNLPVRKQFLKEISEGIDLNGVRTKPCIVSTEPGTKRIFRIILTQGMNRQIRKMCNAYDYQVIKLQRVRVMNIRLGKLQPGQWRDLTKEELDELFSMF